MIAFSEYMRIASHSRDGRVQDYMLYVAPNKAAGAKIHLEHDTRLTCLLNQGEPKPIAGAAEAVHDWGSRPRAKKIFAN